MLSTGLILWTDWLLTASTYSARSNYPTSLCVGLQICEIRCLRLLDISKLEKLCNKGVIVFPTPFDLGGDAGRLWSIEHLCPRCRRLSGDIPGQRRCPSIHTAAMVEDISVWAKSA